MEVQSRHFSNLRKTGWGKFGDKWFINVDNTLANSLPVLTGGARSFPL